MFRESSKKYTNNEMEMIANNIDESTESISIETLENILESKKKQLLKERILGNNGNVLISRQQLKKKHSIKPNDWKHFLGINKKTKGYFGVFFYVFIGVLWCFYYNNLSVIDSIYFAVTTLTSVGYGDIHLDGHINYIFMTFYVLIGVFLVGALLATSLEAIMSEHEESLKDNFAEAGIEIKLILKNIRENVHLDKAFDMSYVPFKTLNRMVKRVTTYMSGKENPEKHNNNNNTNTTNNTTNNNNINISIENDNRKRSSSMAVKSPNKIESAIIKFKNSSVNFPETLSTNTGDTSSKDLEKVGKVGGFLSKRIRHRVNKKKAIKESIIRIHDSTMEVYDNKLNELIYKSIFNLIIVLIFICFGSVVLSYVENWHMITSFYFTSVTITTVGFGDVAPTTNLGKILVTVYILIGCTIVARSCRMVIELPVLVKYQKEEKKILSQFGNGLSDEMLFDILNDDIFKIKNIRIANDNTHSIRKCQFILILLKLMDKLTDNDVILAASIFDSLDLSETGMLSEEDIQREARRFRGLNSKGEIQEHKVEYISTTEKIKRSFSIHNLFTENEDEDETLGYSHVLSGQFFDAAATPSPRVSPNKTTFPFSNLTRQFSFRNTNKSRSFEDNTNNFLTGDEDQRV